MAIMIPFKEHNNMKFIDIYGDVNDFIYDYNNIQIPKIIDTSLCMTLYYLLLGRFANSTIANSSIDQFKYGLFSIIWQYGPAWEKRLDIQTKLRELTDSEILVGAKAIYNHATNPSSKPTTSTLDELEYIDMQNTTNFKKSKMDAYAQLWDLIDIDVTSEFLNRFTKLFTNFPEPPFNLTYIDDNENEGWV